eukprot:jgi/Tetstr1/446289/TSEL_033833.t1
MPGWFNRLFASAISFVAPGKKFGEGGAPEERHVVTVGEAERRATERAVVDNMKVANVSVLAPSQLGVVVGISAGDSMLIHGRAVGHDIVLRRDSPKMEECDNTLEVTDWTTACFNADDGYLVGMPEHVWPARLHAFRTTSIKASVGGFEVEAFAEAAVGATVVLTGVERVLGVSFDPSTYGTDSTDPVVTDFLAELLHDDIDSAA